MRFFIFVFIYLLSINTVFAFRNNAGFYQQINKSLEVGIYKKELTRLTDKLRVEVEDLSNLDTRVLINADLPHKHQKILNQAFIRLHDKYSDLVTEVHISKTKEKILAMRIENTLKHLNQFKEELYSLEDKKQSIAQSKTLILKIQTINKNIDKAIKWSRSPQKKDQENLVKIQVPKGSFLRPVSLIENKDNDEWYTEVKLVDASNKDLTGKTFKVSSNWYNIASMDTIDQQVSLEEVINKGEPNEEKIKHEMDKGKSFIVVNDPGDWFYDVQIVENKDYTMPDGTIIKKYQAVDTKGKIQTKGSRKTYRISKNIYNQAIIKQTVDNISKDFDKVKQFVQKKEKGCNRTSPTRVAHRKQSKIIGCDILNNKIEFHYQDFENLQYCLADIKRRIRDEALIPKKEIPICEKFWKIKEKSKLDKQKGKIKSNESKLAVLKDEYIKVAPKKIKGKKSKLGAKAKIIAKKIKNAKWKIYVAKKRRKRIEQQITNRCSGLNRTKVLSFIKNKLNHNEQDFFAKTLTAEGEAGILALQRKGEKSPKYHEMHAVMKVLENRKNYTNKRSPKKKVNLLDIAISPSQFSMYDRDDPGWERAILSRKSNRQNEENAIKAFMSYPSAKFKNADKVYHYVAKYVYDKNIKGKWWNDKSKVVNMEINQNKVVGNSYTRHYFYKDVSWSYRPLRIKKGQKW